MIVNHDYLCFTWQEGLQAISAKPGKNLAFLAVPVFLGGGI